MKIKQCYISVPVRRSCFKYFMKKHGFKRYTDPKKPAFFFGFYNSKEDVKTLKKHKNLAVLIWRGSDIFRRGHLRFTKKRKHIKHIAISSFIAEDLDRNGIRYKFIPLISSNIDSLLPVPLGNEIYTYTVSNKDKRDIYGSHILKKVIKNCSYKINVVDRPGQLQHKDIIELYKKCFCGLRFTSHDGIANTVIEMGLMGRKCIYNGQGVPNAIPWCHDVTAIIRCIDKEASMIGQTNIPLASKVREYINIGTDWLKTEYY